MSRLAYGSDATKTPYEIEDDIRILYAKLSPAEQACEMVHTLIRSGFAKSTALDDQGWSDLISWHIKLLNHYYDLLSQLRYLTTTLGSFQYFLLLKRISLLRPSSISRPSLLSWSLLPDKIWDYGIGPLLEILPMAGIDHQHRFLCYTYTLMTHLYETVFDLNGFWCHYLQRLTSYR